MGKRKAVRKRIYRWDHASQGWRVVQGFGIGGLLPTCALCGAFHTYLQAWACRKCDSEHKGRLDAYRVPAIREVHRAIKCGELAPITDLIKCVDCGEPAQVYDHREYAKPLEVQPVCCSCNSLRGPAKEIAPFIAAFKRARQARFKRRP